MGVVSTSCNLRSSRERVLGFPISGCRGADWVLRWPKPGFGQNAAACLCGEMAQRKKAGQGGTDFGARRTSFSDGGPGQKGRRQSAAAMLGRCI